MMEIFYLRIFLAKLSFRYLLEAKTIRFLRKGRSKRRKNEES
jgi:hypothetical protein